MMNSQIPPEHEARLGLVFLIDNNCIEEGGGGTPDDIAAMSELRELHRQGWINLAVSGELRHEQDRNSNAKSRERVLAAAANYVEYHSPFILGLSKLGGPDVLAADGDAEAMASAKAAVLVGLGRPDKPAHVSDARHVGITKMYGVQGFITADARLIRSAPRLRDEAAVDVFSPSRALAFVLRMKVRHKARQGTS